MIITLEFDVEVEGDISETEAADIFYSQLTLQNNVISDENFSIDDKKYFAITVRGWSLKDEKENHNA